MKQLIFALIWLPSCCFVGWLGWRAYENLILGPSWQGVREMQAVLGTATTTTDIVFLIVVPSLALLSLIGIFCLELRSEKNGIP